MRRIALILAALTLASCSSLDGQFSNRIARTADGSTVYVVSLWSTWLGIATEVDKRDAAAMAPVPAAVSISASAAPPIGAEPRPRSSAGSP